MICDSGYDPLLTRRVMITQTPAGDLLQWLALSCRLIVVGFSIPAPTSSAAKRRLFAFDKPVAAKNLVHDQQYKRAARPNRKTKQTNRLHCFGSWTLSPLQECTSNQRSCDAHHHRGDRTARISTRHDRLGRQSDNNTKAESTSAQGSHIA